MPQPLSAEDYRFIVSHANLISIDLIIEDGDGRVLVGLRTNEPARGSWFVPGGVIRKGETRPQAFARIIARETGLDVPFEAAAFMGVYEHHYASNTFEDPGFGTDYYVLGYRLSLPQGAEISGDDQHSRFQWLTPSELLAAPDVHENTKAYYRP